MTEKLRSLIIRQPYASLIALGHKRWEFRSYNCRIRGKIGVAASHNPPLMTQNNYLNEVSSTFPRGVLLATARINDSFPVTNDELRTNAKEMKTVVIHGHELLTLNEPIGEPLEDVENAILNPNWSAYAWHLTDVKSLKTPFTYEQPKRSTWVFLNSSEGSIVFE